jgi:hypothetical protein
LFLKLIVTPYPVYGTSPSTQGIDSDPIGEAGFRYLHQAHFLEGLLCSAAGSSKKLRPRWLHCYFILAMLDERNLSVAYCDYMN